MKDIDMEEMEEMEETMEMFGGFHIGEIPLDEMDFEVTSVVPIELADVAAPTTPAPDSTQDNIFVLSREDLEEIAKIRRKIATIYRRKAPNRHFRKKGDPVFVEVGKAHLIYQC